MARRLPVKLSMPALLQLQAVSKHYGALKAVDAVHVAVDDGEALGVIGPNGAGKTTLIRLILGLQPTSAGRVIKDRTSMGYVPQKIVIDPDIPLRARDVVSLGLDGHKLGFALPGKGRRDKVILATKLGVLRFYGNYVKCLDPAVMRIELELSLKRLGTDYIDLYQIHWPEYNNSIERALEELVAMKKEGKIRAIGVSNFSVDQIREAIGVAEIAAVQPPLNMLNRDSIANGVIPFCAEENIGVLTYGSLGGGILAGKAEALPVGGKELRASFYGYYAEPMLSKCRELLAYLGRIAENHNASIAEASINWVLAQKGVTSSLIGAGTPQKAVQNTKAADWELSAEELAGVEAEYKRIMG